MYNVGSTLEVFLIPGGNSKGNTNPDKLVESKSLFWTKVTLSILELYLCLVMQAVDKTSTCNHLDEKSYQAVFFVKLFNIKSTQHVQDGFNF